MKKFDLKKAILENKATFFASLNESRPGYKPEIGSTAYKYYKDAEADDAEHIEALEKDMKDDKKSSKMKKSELKAKIKEMILAEMDLDLTDETSGYDFLAELEDILEAEESPFMKNKPARIAEFIKALDALVDEYHAELYLSDELFAAIEMVKKAANEAINLNEVDKEADAEEEIDVTDEFSTEEPQTKGGINVTQNADADLTGIEKETQDNLEAALEAAKKLGDEKLATQIGNTLTFFTKQHVVK